MNEFLNDYDEKVIALAQYLDIDLEINEEDFEDEEEKEEAIQDIVDELDSITNDYDNTYSYGNGEYLVLTDRESDEEEDRRLDNYLEECIYPELPENLRCYFDDEAWKRDAKMDGRGQIISTYDGYENEEVVNGTTYYIYRV